MSPSGLNITLSQVTKQWGETPAVDAVNLEVAPGTFTALLGPSGCGKSTTLRMIAGLEFPNSGDIVIGQREVTTLSPAERNLAMVFQSYALFPHLSVEENILFGLKTRRVPVPDRKRRLAQVAEMLELSPYLGRKPAQLSGGQQQRVALGRAIIAERPVCLMDEPLSNLDARLRHEMRSEIRRLQRSLGFTMVYVTHDQVEAITMADQVALMNKGKLEQAASPRAIYNTPETVFAARFIGTPPMNLIPLACFGTAAGTLTETPLLVGVRPENLFLAEGGCLKANVTGIEFLGAETLIDCTAEGASFVLKATGTVQVALGDSVSLSFSAEDVHVFDNETGRRRDTLHAEVTAQLCGSQQTHKNPESRGRSS